MNLNVFVFFLKISAASRDVSHPMLGSFSSISAPGAVATTF